MNSTITGFIARTTGGQLAKSALPLTVISLFLLTFPLFGSMFYVHVFIVVFLNVILASSFRPFYVTGLVSLCHGTFYAIGAYASALLAVRLGLPFWVCFLGAGAVPALIAALFAWPAVRAKGAYFFIVSFAFFMVMFSVMQHWFSLTRGVEGIRNIPPMMGLTTVTPYFYLGLAVVAVTILVMYRLDRSRFGKELQAIGDDEDLAEVVGINVVKHRVIAFAIGAVFAGFAGSIYAHYIRFIVPNSFPLWTTIYIFIWCFLGGGQKVWGPIAGAILLTFAAELLRLTGSTQALLYAGVLFVAVMAMPNGIVGLVDTLRATFGGPGAPGVGQAGSVLSKIWRMRWRNGTT
jgi:branched-chain amino acid transport system permease protein